MQKAWVNLRGDAAGMAAFTYDRMSAYVGPNRPAMCAALVQRLIGIVAGEPTFSGGVRGGDLLPDGPCPTCEDPNDGESLVDSRARRHPPAQAVHEDLVDLDEDATWPSIATVASWPRADRLEVFGWASGHGHEPGDGEMPTILKSWKKSDHEAGR